MNKIKKKKIGWSLFIILVMCFCITVNLIGCTEGDEGPEGDQGPQGEQGPAGEDAPVDLLNEAIEDIEALGRIVTSADLIGTWECVSAISGNVTDIDESKWLLQGDALYRHLEDAFITFVDDGDGTYSLTTSSPNPFLAQDQNAFNTEFDVFQNIFWYKVIGSTYPRKYTIDFISQSKFKLLNTYPSGQNMGQPYSMVCESI